MEKHPNASSKPPSHTKKEIDSVEFLAIPRKGIDLIMLVELAANKAHTMARGCSDLTEPSDSALQCQHRFQTPTV
jgi:hypothetical protein